MNNVGIVVQGPVYETDFHKLSILDRLGFKVYRVIWHDDQFIRTLTDRLNISRILENEKWIYHRTSIMPNTTIIISKVKPPVYIERNSNLNLMIDRKSTRLN